MLLIRYSWLIDWQEGTRTGRLVVAETRDQGDMVARAESQDVADYLDNPDSAEDAEVRFTVEEIQLYTGVYLII